MNITQKEISTLLCSLSTFVRYLTQQIFIMCPCYAEGQKMTDTAYLLKRLQVFYHGKELNENLSFLPKAIHEVRLKAPRAQGFCISKA